MKKIIAALVAIAALSLASVQEAQAVDGTIRIQEYYTVAMTQYALAQHRAQSPNWRLQVDMGTNESTYTRWQRCVTQYLGTGLLSSNQYVCQRAWNSP